MKSIYTKISINIIVMFIIAIAMSLVPELHPKFFGDNFCQGWQPKDTIQKCFNSNFHHLPEWHWGYQHWLWFAMGAFLFIVQIVKIINYIDKPPKPLCQHDWQPATSLPEYYDECMLCHTRRGRVKK